MVDPATPLATGVIVPEWGELVAASHWRTIDFISDLHLQPTEPATVVAWLQYLQTTTADALFVLGDLFEVWVGDDALQEPGSFEAQGAAALKSASQRLSVYFMHGNRDFLAGPEFLSESGAIGLSDPTVLVFGHQRLVLSHGDLLCLDDVEYQQFRVLARSAQWQTRFLSQSLHTRRAQARDIRSQSEQRKQSGAPYADVDDDAALVWLDKARATTLVHGHTHRPAEHDLAPGLQRVVLSDWDLAATPARGDVLRLSETGLTRWALSAVAAA